MAGIRKIMAQNDLTVSFCSKRLERGSLETETGDAVRSHSSLGYRPPAPPTFKPFLSALDQVTAMQLSLNRIGTINSSGPSSDGKKALPLKIVTNCRKFSVVAKGKAVVTDIRLLRRCCNILYLLL